jgi:hypothetical protein
MCAQGVCRLLITRCYCWSTILDLSNGQKLVQCGTCLFKVDHTARSQLQF